jgi:hypothetical protein
VLCIDLCLYSYACVTTIMSCFTFQSTLYVDSLLYALHNTTVCVKHSCQNDTTTVFSSVLKLCCMLIVCTATRRSQLISLFSYLCHCYHYRYYCYYCCCYVACKQVAVPYYFVSLSVAASAVAVSAVAAAVTALRAKFNTGAGKSGADALR